MNVIMVWAATVLLVFHVSVLCAVPLNVMIAPNLLRVGTPEKVFVEVQDHEGNADVKVEISVKNYPRKTKDLASVSVTLTHANNYQDLVTIKIPDNKEFFSEDPLEKQYVYVQANFPTSQLEKVVMVSFQSGYIFIQTDKSIYTPESEVKYRLFSLTPDLQPNEKNFALIEILNHQGIPIFAETKSIEQTTTGVFKIPEVASPGIWSVVARYKNTPQKNFTAEFEVKEYVLPSFEVTLTSSKPFFYVNSDELEVKIKARYLFGKDVEGMAYIVFGVLIDGVKNSLPDSLGRVMIIKGEGTAKLTKEMIEQSYDINTLVGKPLFISVSVLTESGSEMVEAHKTGILIVRSPYTISFKHTPQYFKPGIPFDVMVYVTNPDQSPAKHVDVVVTEGLRGRTKENGIAKFVMNTQLGLSTLQITAKTIDEHLSDQEQATEQMTAKAYATKGGSKNYIHISVDKTELRVNDPLRIDLQFGQSNIGKQDFTYMLLSKGQIVKAERHKGQGESLIAKNIVVTKDLVPSFRLVAYYHVGADEVVADSTWIDVLDTCMGSLKLSVKEHKDEKRSFQPSDEFNLVVTGDPGAKVGLVAVDKAVFVLNKNRLTQSKIWDIVEKHDTGCTVGSGKNNMGVFYDAGLMFESDKAGGTESRTDLKCPTPQKRKRRAESLQQKTQSLSGKYEGEIKKCCVDGMKQNRLQYTCDRRATYILDGPECVQAFLHCCKEIEKHKANEQTRSLLLARSEEEDEYMSPDEFTTRSQFPESWLWEDITLPVCQGLKCETTSYAMSTNYMKDSITTWQFLAISLSKTHSICVADPYEMVVTMNFFIDLKLPYSAVRNEQIEIKAILHNYSNRKQKVKVNFMEIQNICSGASKKGKFTTIIYVEKMSTKAVPHVIIPMEIGEFVIEVQAMSADYGDAVRKTLKVVAEGQLIEKVVLNEELNPSKKGGIQQLQVRSSEPEGRIPNTPANTYISVSGQEISQTIEQAISGDFMGRLIVQPHGCGEQTMIFMTLPLIATHYLDSTNQWEFVGMQRRNEAVKHIKTGYDRELTFRKEDGSYGAWLHHPSSTWLTAYVAKVFALASDIIVVQDDVLCSALRWLILNGQMPEGLFRDSAPVIHGEMVGDVRGKDADASLTAFVLIAMQEGSGLCEKKVAGLSGSMKKASDYLEKRLPLLSNPYAVAMTSYAMATAGKFNKELLMKHSSEDGTFWRVAGQHHFSLEATAYAILALVKAKDFEAAGKAVRWLNKQTTYYGGSGTTQATIMVFQAVAEYYKQARTSQNVDLNVEVTVSKRSQPIKWKFSKSNMYVTRSDKVKLSQDFNVTVQGTGTGSIKVMTLYYARPLDNPGDCKAFDLSVSMEKEPSGRNEKETYLVTIEYLYKNPNKDATMSILDIGLLTGFVVNKEDLKLLSTGKDRYVQKFDMDKQLSEKGSLIIYLDKVSHTMPERIVFRVHKEFTVDLLQPAAVSLYEYYSPERCVKYYHPKKKDGALSRLCTEYGDLCQCAEENCSFQKKKQTSDSDREKTACLPGMDYVYKVTVLSRNESAYTSYYFMKIDEVLKEGSDANVRGQERRFIGNANCAESHGFVDGKSYLIMGRSDDLPMVHKKLQYILGEHTWIEYWPSREEGQTDEYQNQYVGINALAQTLADFGCTT